MSTALSEGTDMLYELTASARKLSEGEARPAVLIEAIQRGGEEARPAVTDRGNTEGWGGGKACTTDRGVLIEVMNAALE